MVVLCLSSSKNTNKLTLDGLAKSVTATRFVSYDCCKNAPPTNEKVQYARWNIC